MRFVSLFCAFFAIASAQPSPNVESVGVRLGGLAYPRVAMDNQGGVVKLSGPAMRIVSLSTGVDEYLYQFVPPERIVGVSKSAYDESFSAVLDKLKPHKPSIVKDAASILALKPDLVIGSDSMSMDSVDGLKEAGVPVFGMMTTPLTLDQVAANIAVLGYITGTDDAAAVELKRFQGEVARLREQCKAPHGDPRIYGVSMTGFSYGDHTLFQDVMRVVRGTNVAAQNGLHTYERVALPSIAEWNPDWVFTWAVPGNHDYELKRWMEDPYLSKTSASRNGRVIVLQAKEVLPLSPLITGFMNEIAKATCPKE